MESALRSSQIPSLSGLNERKRQTNACRTQPGIDIAGHMSVDPAIPAVYLFRHRSQLPADTAGVGFG